MLHFADYSDMNLFIFLQPKAKKKMSIKVPKDDLMTEVTKNDLIVLCQLLRNCNT